MEMLDLCVAIARRTTAKIGLNKNGVLYLQST